VRHERRAATTQLAVGPIDAGRYCQLPLLLPPPLPGVSEPINIRFRMKTKYAIIAVGLGLLLLALWLPQRPDRSVARLFVGTTNIVLADTDARDTEFYTALRNTNQPVALTNVAPIRLTLTNLTEIQHLLDTLQLRRKDPCACGPHAFEATFQVTNRSIRVSFCDHCFDLYPSNPNGTAVECLNYKMPPQFFAMFRELVEAEIRAER
jgi:hypothetical protein